MQEKYKNRYRIESTRLQRWDYGSATAYFITICTKNRGHYFGKIVRRDAMLCVSLSEIGKIVESEWYKSFEIRSELFLDEFVIMPNHLHAIIILEKSKNQNINQSHQSHVETHGRASLQSTDQTIVNSTNKQFIRLPKSISSFIGGYKSAINSKIDDYIDENNLNMTKYNRNNHFFQPDYHDHIIRNNIEYQRIKQYIINNPTNWNID